MHSIAISSQNAGPLSKQPIEHEEHRELASEARLNLVVGQLRQKRLAERGQLAGSRLPARLIPMSAVGDSWFRR
jgi:hypothetical protein